MVQTDGSKEGWGAILLAKDNKSSPVSEERLRGYSSVKWREKDKNMTSICYESLAVIYIRIRNF